MHRGQSAAVDEFTAKVEYALGRFIKSVFEGFEAVEDKVKDEDEGVEERSDISLLQYIQSTVDIVGYELRNLLAAHPDEMRHRLKTKHIAMLTCCDAMFAWLESGKTDEIHAATEPDEDEVLEWLQVSIGKMPPGGEKVGAPRGFLQTIHEVMYDGTTSSRRRHATENFCAMVDVTEWADA